MQFAYECPYLIPVVCPSLIEVLANQVVGADVTPERSRTGNFCKELHPKNA